MSNRGPTPTRYVKKTRVPWSSRLGNAFQGILVGLLLVVAGLILLFYNALARLAFAGSDILCESMTNEPSDRDTAIEVCLNLRSLE